MSFAKGLAADELRTAFTEVVTHTLETERFCLEHRVDPHLVQADLGILVQIGRDMACRLSAYIYGKWEEPESFDFPADWWSAFKIRWFPKWALRRWPPVMTHVEVKRGVIYPEFANCGRGVTADRIIIHETGRRGKVFSR